ncbi:mitochondrial carrier domain-containing protein [Phyllosticta capitalensis]
MTAPVAHAAPPPQSRLDSRPETMQPQAKIDKQSWEYVVKSGLAGGVASCAAKTVVGPLDRVKILLQASNPQFVKYSGSWLGIAQGMGAIYNQNGVRGLFKGHSATLLRIFPYGGIKFLAYEQIRAVFIRDKSQETPVRRFLSGSTAGIISVFFTYPLEVIRVRLAFETRQDSRSTFSTICKKIYNEKVAPRPVPGGSPAPVAAATATVQAVTPRHGLGNFFRGFTPTIWGMFPYAGASFLTHDTASDLMRHPRLAPYTTLPNTEGGRPASKGGRKDHLDGGPETRRNPQKPAQLRYWAELATGGLAGFVGQTCSYPLEVIRRRMQVGGVVGDGHKLGMAETARTILLERGWRGFFVGLTIGYIKVIPMVATSFYVYERSKFYLGI